MKQGGDTFWERALAKAVFTLRRRQSLGYNFLRFFFRVGAQIFVYLNYYIFQSLVVRVQRSSPYRNALLPLRPEK